jgi:FkbM family methyltransferase
VEGLISRRIIAVILLAIAIAVAVWWLRPRRPTAPVSDRRETVKVMDVPAHGDGDVELWKMELGRVVVRSLQNRQKLQFHRHAHETWIPLGEAEATWSQRGGWAQARLSSPQMLYTPPYSISAWKGGGVMLGFIAAPEDEPSSGSSLEDAADAVVLDGDAPWMLEKLERITVPATRRLGPWSREIVIYVVSGKGELRADGAHEVAAPKLASIAAGTMVDVVAKSPLTLVIFDAARTTVSPILKEGSKVYSQDDEELVIRDFFRDRRDGFFLDVGAGHWRRDSTTLYLEERLGWSGVAVDALAEYAEDYRLHRKRTTFVNRLITDKARGPQKFYRAESYPEVSSVSKQLAEKQARELADGGAVQELTVPSSTLDEVLDGLGVKAIDFLSMDIEEHEPAALAGFDIERFHPAFVCVEAHPAVRDALWRYFRQHGYVRQDQYLAWDSANWYFARR